MTGFKRALSMLILMGCLTAPVQADSVGHAHYLQALDDLHRAQALITRMSEMDQYNQAAADVEIHRALEEAQRADFNPGTATPWYPPTHLSHRDRLKQALLLLSAARQDLTRDAPPTDPTGWRQATLDHVNAAMGFIAVSLASSSY